MRHLPVSNEHLTESAEDHRPDACSCIAHLPITHVTRKSIYLYTCYPPIHSRGCFHQSAQRSRRICASNSNLVFVIAMAEPSGIHEILLGFPIIYTWHFINRSRRTISQFFDSVLRKCAYVSLGWVYLMALTRNKTKQTHPGACWKSGFLL